jgi:hypothetical protein
MTRFQVRCFGPFGINASPPSRSVERSTGPRVAVRDPQALLAVACPRSDRDLLLQARRGLQRPLFPRIIFDRLSDTSKVRPLRSPQRRHHPRIFRPGRFRRQRHLDRRPSVARISPGRCLFARPTRACRPSLDCFAQVGIRDQQPCDTKGNSRSGLAPWGLIRPSRLANTTSRAKTEWRAS